MGPQAGPWNLSVRFSVVADRGDFAGGGGSAKARRGAVSIPAMTPAEGPHPDDPPGVSLRRDNRGLESKLGRRLIEASATELLALLEEHLDALTPNDAQQALRNPHASAAAVAVLLRARHLRSAYRVRCEIASHRQSPEVDAIGMVPGLYWRDLARMGSDTRVRPRVRRSADLALSARLPGMALGERVALARAASPALIQQLRLDPHPRVVAALLDNRRMTEDLLLPLVASAVAASESLRVVARHPRWGVRYPVRAALAGNRRTPVEVALDLLPALRKSELRRVRNDLRLDPNVVRRARLLLGEDLT